MPPDTIQPIQDILNRWILIGQALVGSIGALAFVVGLAWTMTVVAYVTCGGGRLRAGLCAAKSPRAGLPVQAWGDDVTC